MIAGPAAHTAWPLAHASRQTKDLATATVARAKPSAAAPPSGAEAAAAAELAWGHAGSLLKDGFLYKRPPASPGMFEAEKAMHLSRWRRAGPTPPR